MELPDKEYTLLEEYGANFSGGQRQRLSVARALLSGAHYLILDEPTSAMDAVGTAELVGILREIAKDRCMIVIAHTPSVLALADRVVILEDGMVTVQGEKEAVRTASEFLRTFSREEAAEE